MRMLVQVFASFLALLTTGAVEAAPIPVTSCGQVVGGTGLLTADLDCTNPGHVIEGAVVLTHGSKLRLNGFTLTQGSVGVKCEGNCSVRGPGTVRSPNPPQLPGGSCTGTYAVSGAKLKLTDVHLENFSWGAIGTTWVRAKDVTIDGCCFGISTLSAKVLDSTISDNTGFGVRGIDRVLVKDSTVTGQPTDLVSTTKPVLTRSTCVTSGDGSSPPGQDFWGVCAAP